MIKTREGMKYIDETYVKSYLDICFVNIGKNGNMFYVQCTNEERDVFFWLYSYLKCMKSIGLQYDSNCAVLRDVLKNYFENGINTYPGIDNSIVRLVVHLYFMSKGNTEDTYFGLFKQRLRIALIDMPYGNDIRGLELLVRFLGVYYTCLKLDSDFKSIGLHFNSIVGKVESYYLVLLRNFYLKGEVDKETYLQILDSGRLLKMGYEK